MTTLALVLRGLRHFWRAHLGVVAGAALAAAILTGALAVGDSVRFSLREKALARIGDTSLAMHSPTRFFRESLGGTLGTELKTRAAAMTLLPATASDDSGDIRVGRVTALGVTPEFFALGKANVTVPKDGEVAINEPLARALGAKIGDEILLRVDKPGLLSRDAPLATVEDATVALRVKVSAIVDESRYGSFSLEANQTPPLNAFLSARALQTAIGMPDRANTLLVSGDTLPEAATGALWKHWRLLDSGLELRERPKHVELRTSRIFLDPPVADAAQKAVPGARGVLTYFVNRLTLGRKLTPYSTVAAIDSSITRNLKDDEIVLNRWCADDLSAKVGDKIEIAFWLVGPQRKLVEKSVALTVKAIVPIEGDARDPELMPDIPGLTDKKNCREWEPGVPIDLDKMRDKDQAYWDAFRGTPKAFISLAAGQKFWDNRFGNLTAIRYPNGAGGKSTAKSVEMCLRTTLSPASQGLFFTPLRERALAASGASTDFGGLFLGFSLFLVVSALILCALLFGFSVDRRRGEFGTLLAVGFTPARVRHLLRLEGGALALVASLIGVGVGTLYTRAVIFALNGVWRVAIADSSLKFSVTPATLVGGALGSFLVALLSIHLVARSQGKSQVRALLSTAPASEMATARVGRAVKISAPITAALALLATIAGFFAQGEAAAGVFFTAGALCLISGLLFCRLWLGRGVAPNAHGSPGTLRALSLRGVKRRPGRSLTAIALLASGSFLVLAVGASRHDPTVDADKKTSGTGGFALWAEAPLPVYVDLNDSKARADLGLSDDDLSGANVTALRVKAGDDASCLNLNKAQAPRLLGVDPAKLSGRFTFAQGAGWDDLGRGLGDGVIPVIGDTNTVVWSLQKKVGDTLIYTDERGRARTLKIVGVTANAVFQGSLLMSEQNFLELFPSHSGYQTFLIDASPARATAVSASLTRGLADNGFFATSTTERLAAFGAVENTYLSIFGALGGLGLILGSAGLGVIVLRNVEERRGEISLLRALGFDQSTLVRLLLVEHAALLVAGLVVGIVSALIAIVPSLRGSSNVPWLSLALTLCAVFASGFLWVYLAARSAVSGKLLESLRSE